MIPRDVYMIPRDVYMIPRDVYMIPRDVYMIPRDVYMIPRDVYIIHIRNRWTRLLMNETQQQPPFIETYVIGIGTPCSLLCAH